MSLWMVAASDRVLPFYGPLPPERLPQRRSILWRRHGSNGHRGCACNFADPVSQGPIGCRTGDNLLHIFASLPLPR